MAKLLTLDEMLEAGRLSNLPGIEDTIKCFECLASIVAAELADHLDVETGPATFAGLALAGTCAPFYPKHASQPCPPPLDQFDPTEWEPR